MTRPTTSSVPVLLLLLVTPLLGQSPSTLPPPLSSLSGVWNNVRVCANDFASPREVCGPPGTSEQQCFEAGCCWDSSNTSLPWCFLPNTPSDWNNPSSTINSFYGSHQAIPSTMSLKGGIHASFSGDVAASSCGAIPPYVQECDYDYGTLDTAYGFPNNFLVNGEPGNALLRFKWDAYGMHRMGTGDNGAGFQVQSEVRMMDTDAAAVLVNITVGSLSVGSQATVSAYLPLLWREFLSSPWGWDHPQQAANLADYTHSLVQVTNLTTVVLSQDTLSSAVSAASVWSDTGIAPQLTLGTPPIPPTLKASSSPSSSSTTGQAGFVTWTFTVKSQQPLHFGFVMVVDRNATQVVATAASLSNIENTESFPQAWTSVETERDAIWNDVFTPNNTRFTGSLPVLSETTNTNVTSSMLTMYYGSVLSVLQCWKKPPMLPTNNSNETYPFAWILPSAAPIKSVSTMYLWDSAYASPIIYRLDPVGMLKIVESLLQIDIHQHYALDAVSLTAVGPWYAFNDLCVALLLTNAAKYTPAGQADPVAFWVSELAGKRVIDWLDASAVYWQSLPPISPKNTTSYSRKSTRGNTDTGSTSTEIDDKSTVFVSPSVSLADYGLAENLLECVPTYLHAVPSLNAANIWMMNQTAQIWDLLGNSTRAEYLRTQAEALLPVVLELYVNGTGYWGCGYPDGSIVGVQHVIDFFTVSESIGELLPSYIQDEMMNFVKECLLTPTWMRALSLTDPAAGASDRSDHGPYGAYAAWPTKTIDGFLALGRIQDAYEMFDRVQVVLQEGPLGQSNRVYNNPLLPTLQAAKATTDQQYSASASASFAATVLRMAGY